MPQCRSCKKEIWFVKTKKGKYLPVDEDPKGEKEFNRDTMVSHFETCPDADKFRKTK